MTYKSKEIFKGGSLGRTELMENQFGLKLVRKSISKKENREYGLVRWHSQYKRLQSYNILFPDTFPKLLQVGHEESFYFFDLEYLEGFINLKDYMSNKVVSNMEAGRIAEKIFHSAYKMHSYAKINSCYGAFELYLEEECFSKLEDASQNYKFNQFIQQRKIVFNNEEVNNLMYNKEWLQKFVAQLKVNNECYTHGNLTLENILYNPKSGELKFIDPYEENIIDCAESDFSQIKQCSTGHYGLIMQSDNSIKANEITVNYYIPESFNELNNKVDQLISENLKNYNTKAEDFFYVSQFYRMLPFKVQSGNIDQAIVFYGLACKLVENLREKYE